MGWAVSWFEALGCKLPLRCGWLSIREWGRYAAWRLVVVVVWVCDMGVSCSIIPWAYVIVVVKPIGIITDSLVKNPPVVVKEFNRYFCVKGRVNGESVSLFMIIPIDSS